ncbi:Rnu3ip2 protein [Crassisporium funariophilum]|nr:Rnu3ip2 protein [Crassisporium funariophilum]
MPDSFFTSSKPRKRKRTESHADASGNGKKFARKNTTPRDGKKPGAAKVNGVPKRKARDEELSDQTDEDAGGVDDMDLRADDEDLGASGDEDENETPAEKRLRLAQLYLESVKVGLADGEFDAAEIDKDLISARLKQDVLEHSGKVHLFIADSFDFTHTPNTILRTRGHRFSVTSAVASETGQYIFTSGKEGSIIKWDLATGKKLSTIHKVRPTNSDKKGKGKATPDPSVKGHTDEILSLALSGDGKLLASAGRDRRLCVWDTEKGEWVKSFSGHLGHKDVISTVAFRKGTNQLYSGSFDRTVKVYDLSPSVMGYVETLFGHQDHVLGLDALRGETCVSVGGRDKTVRYWKIVDETQLVFRGGGRSRVREVLEGGLRGDDEGDDVDADGMELIPKAKDREREKKFVEGSIECLAMIDDTTFLSGGDSGSICLWNSLKKKPIFTQALAHGFNEVLSESEGIIQTPRWITALASLRYSDLIVSGSWEGDIRIWKLDSKLKSFSLVGKIPAPGVVNSLQLLTPPKGFLETTTWASQSPQAVSESSAPSTKRRELEVNPFVIVAGLGQEHKLGRWLSVKEGGAVNGSMVVAFSPRTSD